MKNIEQLSQLLSVLTEPDDWVEIRRIDNQKDGSRQFWGRPQKLPEKLAQSLHDESAVANWYFGVNPRFRDGGASAADIRCTQVFFVDIDNTGSISTAEKRVAKAGLPLPTAAVRSGRGIHLYWRMKSPMYSLEAWTAIQKALAEAVGSDTAVSDPARVMRIPGTVNPKNGKPAKLVFAVSGRRYSIGLFLNTLSSLSKRTRRLARKSTLAIMLKRYAAKLDKQNVNPSVVRRMLDTAVPRNSRSESPLFALARFLKFDIDASSISTNSDKFSLLCRMYYEAFGAQRVGDLDLEEMKRKVAAEAEKALFPLDGNPVLDALDRAKEDAEMPSGLEKYDGDDELLLLIRWCYAIGGEHEQPFFITCSVGAKGLHMTRDRFNRRMLALVKEGILELVSRGHPRQKGSRGRATRYRWAFGKAASNGEDASRECGCAPFVAVPADGRSGAGCLRYSQSISVDLCMSQSIYVYSLALRPTISKFSALGSDDSFACFCLVTGNPYDLWMSMAVFFTKSGMLFNSSDPTVIRCNWRWRYALNTSTG